MNEDQGQSQLDTAIGRAGVSSTHGEWQHVAVTWDSYTGHTVLYLDGVRIWQALRNSGGSIPPAGTLVIGREQDCVGGMQYLTEL